MSSVSLEHAATDSEVGGSQSSFTTSVSTECGTAYWMRQPTGREGSPTA